MDQVAIAVEHVSKTFRVPHERYTSLKQNAIHLFSQKSYRRFEAVRDVSFEVGRGEFFGIVGRNGSGKSTLLKILAGIYLPSKGQITINGSLSPFIELGVGFNPDLSARDNVFLNGAILGLSRQQVAAKFHDIIGFAELAEFVDQKLKNFSSGMQVRLAFSIAIQAQSDILLIDEVLAVGDAAFQKKCFDVFRQLKRQGKTIIFVTHDMATVAEFCDRVLVMSEGREYALVGANQAVDIYNQLNLENNLKAAKPPSAASDRWGSRKVEISDVELVGAAGDKPIFRAGDDFAIRLKLEPKQPLGDGRLLVGLAVFSSDGLLLAGPNSGMHKFKLEPQTITYRLDRLPLPDGLYQLTVALYWEKPDGSRDTLDYIDRGFTFGVTGVDQQLGASVWFGNWASGRS